MTDSQTTTTITPVIHPATRMGHVHYTTPNLDRQIAFYQSILGFKLHWREGDSAGLGAGGEDLLRLTEVPTARQARRTTGLYHTAFLTPTRWELAQWLKRIAETQTPIQGMSNHGTHHAIYLPDVDGNGIELAWDLPKAQWPKTAREMIEGNRGLAPETVFGALADDNANWDGAHRDTQVGHVHLHVASLAPTKHFYHDILGFGIPFDFADAPGGFDGTALFFAAGDYHHHIGTNIWQGEGAPPPPPNAIGLRYFTVIVPDAAELERVIQRAEAAGVPVERDGDAARLHDPARNGVRLTASA